MRVTNIVLSLFLLCGCQNHSDLSKANSNFDKIINVINDHKDQHIWDFPYIQNNSLNRKEIAKRYRLKMSNIRDFHVSISNELLGEIAFFNVSKSEQKQLCSKLKIYVQNIKNKYQVFFNGHNQLLNYEYVGVVGTYCYLILGVDGKKVVNYIKELV